MNDEIISELKSIMDRAEAIRDAFSGGRNPDDEEGIAISVIGKALAMLTDESKSAVLAHFSERYPRLERKLAPPLIRGIAEDFTKISKIIDRLQGVK